MRSVVEFSNLSHDSAASLPYSMNGCEIVELFFKMFAARLLTHNHKRNDIETLVAANYLLGKTNRHE